MIARFTLIVFIVICIHQPVFAKNDLIVVGSDWCPYICTEQGNPQKLAPNPGYLIEILQYALKDKTIGYESPSWKRAILETRNGNYDAVIGIFKSVAPDLIYAHTPQGYSQMCFTVQKDNPWVYNGIDSLEHIRLGVIEGYYYDEGAVDQYIENHSRDSAKIESIPGERGLIQNLEKLFSNRISGVIDDHQVVQYTLMKNSLSNVFKYAGCLKGIDVHIGFSPKNPDAGLYAQKLAQALLELRKTGQLDKILDKYGIEDWQ